MADRNLDTAQSVEDSRFSRCRLGSLPCVALVAGLLITVVIAAVIHHRDRLYSQDLFEHEAKLLEGELQERLDDYQNILRACHGIVAHDPELEPRDWHTFVSSLDIATTFQGVELLSFIRYVHPQDRAAFEARQQQKYAGFAIQPPGERDDYLVVTLVEPSPALRSLVGFDVGTDPLRRALAERAGERGKAELSNPIPALSALPLGAANIFLYYLPLYRTVPPPETPEERRRALIGWVSINFAIDGFVHGIVDAHPALDIAIWNGPDPGNAIRLYGGALEDAREAGFRSAGTLSIGDRSWALIVRSTPRFEDTMDGYTVPSVLIIGALISLMLSRYLALLIDGRRNAYALAQLKTRELEIAHDELTRAFNDLKDAQVQLVHAEKMASLGQLVAGVAHELNNPISFIYSNSTHLEDYIRELFALIDALRQLPNNPAAAARCEDLVARAELEYLREDIFKIIHSGKDGASRVKDIVLSLRRFSRLDEAERKPVPLEDGLNDTLAILHHKLKTDITVVRDYQLNLQVPCFPGQINQVFMNILVNAIQAMVGGGTLKVGTRAEPPWAVVEVTDTGSGIPPDVLPRIFDPFFTTKKVGEGTGLGLSISYGIVDRHGGRIQVQSAVGTGTTFEIRLPFIQPLSTVSGEP
ncbi:MAG: CHASE domain-containing protein [Alphaproteobacteria bacterium]|nr:CHASE domain-containing protein [Alphaproteobacteria bacterium]